MGALWGAEVTPTPPRSLTFHSLHLLPCGRRRARDAHPEWGTEVKGAPEPGGTAKGPCRRLHSGHQRSPRPYSCNLRMRPCMARKDLAGGNKLKLSRWGDDPG